MWTKGFKHDCQNRPSLPMLNGCRGYDGMVVEFTITYAISTEVVSSNTAHGEVYSIQHYVIKFVSDLRQFGDFIWYSGFLRIHQYR